MTYQKLPLHKKNAQRQGSFDCSLFQPQHTAQRHLFFSLSPLFSPPCFAQPSKLFVALLTALSLRIAGPSVNPMDLDGDDRVQYSIAPTQKRRTTTTAITPLLPYPWSRPHYPPSSKRPKKRLMSSPSQVLVPTSLSPSSSEDHLPAAQIRVWTNDKPARERAR